VSLFLAVTSVRPVSLRTLLLKEHPNWMPELLSRCEAANSFPLSNRLVRCSSGFISGGHTTNRFSSFVMRLRPLMEGSRASFAECACPGANALDCRLFYNCIVRNFMRVMHFTWSGVHAMSIGASRLSSNGHPNLSECATYEFVV
jgi:hypothetical protein